MHRRWALGYADGRVDASTGGAPTNQIIISPQLAADAIEDGKVDFNDLLALAQNVGSITADWVHADFNFDGVIDFNDLLLLAQNINKTNGNTPLRMELPVKMPLAVNGLFSSEAIVDSTDSSATEDVLESMDRQVLCA